MWFKSFEDEFKLSMLTMEQPDGQVYHKNCYVRPDTPYAIYAGMVEFTREGCTHRVTRWYVIHLTTRVLVASELENFKEAATCVKEILDRQEQEARFDESVLEERILATRPLPDRWAACVAQLEKAYGLA